MLLFIILLLASLWYIGYVQISIFPLLNHVLLTINSHAITIWEVLIFLVTAWAVGILPSPIKQVAGILLLLWLLATFGIIPLIGFSNILVIAIIVGLAFFFLEGGI